MQYLSLQGTNFHVIMNANHDTQVLNYFPQILRFFLLQKDFFNFLIKKKENIYFVLYNRHSTQHLGHKYISRQSQSLICMVTGIAFKTFPNLIIYITEQYHPFIRIICCYQLTLLLLHSVLVEASVFSTVDYMMFFLSHC